MTPCCGFPTISRSTKTTSRSAFVRASGPGGQNVNKLATAAQLRFDTRKAALPEDAAARLNRLAGQRMTKEGVIVIHAQRFRTQERNRADAIDRLLELLQEAMVRPVPRRATKPTFGSKQRRLEGKKRRSDHQGRPRFARLRRLEHAHEKLRPHRGRSFVRQASVEGKRRG